MPVAEHIQSILRSTNRNDKLNILVIGCTHERYEQTLCLTGHNFYCFKNGKAWDYDYGKKPDNYILIDDIPFALELDLILLHTSCERVKIAYDLRNFFNIPILRHTHILPDIRYDVKNQIDTFKQIKVDFNTFISEYNMKAWGYNYNNAAVVNHGLNTDFWCENLINDRNNYLLSVVNLWPHRDWACGWNLWKNVVSFDGKQSSLPIKIVGKNDGLSKPAASIEDLRNEYYKAKIFLNTSLHSPVPMSLLEAMACGCAVVSTDTCMIPEIIKHGYNGLLGNNAEKLKTHCMSLLYDNDLSNELGKNAQDTIKNLYNINKFVNQWNNIFERVVHK